MLCHLHLSVVSRRALETVAAGGLGAAFACLMLHTGGHGVLVGVMSTLMFLLSAVHLFLREREAKAAPCETPADDMPGALGAEDLDELLHIAFHDSLTGLPNRRRLLDRLHDALKRANGGRGQEFNLLFLDFDHFKLINDTLGHRAGDEFLVRTSRLMQQQLRPQDVVARLGGDEFAILVEGPGCAEYAVGLANRMLKLLSQPMLIEGVSVVATASIGITSSRFGYVEPSDVLRDADIAMYRAKSAGKARYVLFDAGMQRQPIGRLPTGSVPHDAFRRDGIQTLSARVGQNVAAA